MNTFKQWMLEKFERDELRDMVEHGVQGGFSGLIYYQETVELYEQYYQEIWEMLCDEANSLGMNPVELINNFRRSSSVVNHKEFVNLLVWFAAEKVAYDVIENGDYS